MNRWLRAFRIALTVMVVGVGLLALATPAQATRVVWANETKCSVHNRCVEFGVQVANLNGDKMYALGRVSPCPSNPNTLSDISTGNFTLV